MMKAAVLTILSAALLTAATVELLAGGGTSAAGAPAKEIQLVEPFAVALDAKGNWYICEYKGQRITRVDRAGNTSPFAATAMLKDPHGIVIGKDQKMYVADTLNHVIRRIDLKSGAIETIAGTGEPGFAGDGGPATGARFNGTFGIDVNRAGDKLYVADLNNRRVRMIDLKSGAVSTVAGNGESGVPADGSQAAKSPLVDPRAVAVDSNGSVYILERRGNALRVVDTAGKIRTLIAPGSVSPDMNGPKHLCVDGKDRVIIADAENHLVRMFDASKRTLVTIAGIGKKGTAIAAGDPLRTELNRPHGVTPGPGGSLYVSDSYNHRILRISGY